MEIVSKITEPKLVWEIFTYVAEAPLTKEKRKQIEEWRVIWSENGEYHPFPKFIEYSVADKAVDLEHEIDNSPAFIEGKPISIILKLFENQEYDWTQQNSDQIDQEIFDKWDRDNGNSFDFHTDLYVMRSLDVGVKLPLDYNIIPPRFWCIAEEDYRKAYSRREFY